jgi:hypothetical protein
LFYWDGTRWTHEPGTGPKPRAPRSRLRRIGDWILTVAALIGLMAVALPFDPVNAKTPSISVAPGTGLVGDAVTVTGTGFAPHSQLQLTWDQSPASVPLLTSNGQGRFTVQFTIPSAALGPHTVAAMATSSTGGGRPPKSNVARTLIVGATFTVVSALSVSPSSAATPILAPTATPQGTAAPLPTATPRPTATPSSTATPVPPAPTPVPATPVPATPVPATPVPQSSAAKLLFGLGPEVDGAKDASLTLNAPVRLMSMWWNTTNDANGWLTDAYHRSMFASQYALGRSIHLISWANGRADGTFEESSFSTPRGTACGRSYPLSDQYLLDLDRVIDAVSGSGQLYVTLFTEFQTYPCLDNAWFASAQVTNYYKALQDRYMVAMQHIHARNAAAKVSLGWGGWQWGWDDPALGGGRSLVPYFADLMRASDFQSFQSMMNGGNGNADDIQQMTEILNDYGPVMLAHYQPNNGDCVTFASDVHAIFTDQYMADVVGRGLFAFSFMEDNCLDQDPTLYQFVKDAVIRYGR